VIAYPDDFRSRSVIDAVQFRVGRAALTEKHHSASQCRATSTVPVDCIDFAISNPLSPAATPRREFARTVAYHQAALSPAALRIWITFRRARRNFSNSLPTIQVLRVTSAALRVALDAFLPRYLRSQPAERCNAIRHAKDNFSRCPSTSMSAALVHGRAVSRGSGFLEDSDYCRSRLHGGFTRDR